LVFHSSPGLLRSPRRRSGVARCQVDHSETSEALVCTQRLLYQSERQLEQLRTELANVNWELGAKVGCNPCCARLGARRNDHRTLSEPDSESGRCGASAQYVALAPYGLHTPAMINAGQASGCAVNKFLPLTTWPTCFLYSCSRRRSQNCTSSCSWTRA
jgi:hypothetical protein